MAEVDPRYPEGVFHEPPWRCGLLAAAGRGIWPSEFMETPVPSRPLLVQVGDSRWVNPAHVTSVVRYGSTSCVLNMVGGTAVRVDDRPVVEVLDLLGGTG